MEQSKKSAITRQKILASAQAEFAKNGLSAARVDDIARGAGVNKQLIYAHFSSKENLYSVILDKVYSHLADFESSLGALTADGIDIIETIVTQYFHYLVANPDFVRLMLWENLNNAAFIRQKSAFLFSGTKKLLAEGIEKGFVRSDLDIDQLAMSVNLFCFSSFSNIHTLSTMLGKDLLLDDEMTKRAKHVSEVLTKYIM